MNILNLCKRDKVARNKFINFVDEVVVDGARDFDSLCIADKRQMTALLINALDDRTEWLVEGDADTTIHLLTRYMVRNNVYNREDFIEAIQDQAVKFYAYSLNEFMQELRSAEYQAKNEDYFRANPHLLDPEYINGTNYRR